MLERVLQIINPAVYKADTAIQRILDSVLDEVSLIMKDSEKREPIKRIWTLHKIEGGYSKFYKSDGSRNTATDLEIDRKTKKIGSNSGLIVKSILERRPVSFYSQARSEEGYVDGWEECQSEMIVLIKNSEDLVVGVINIESNQLNDFKEQEDLINLFKIVSTVMSVIFREQEAKDINDVAFEVASEITRSDISKIPIESILKQIMKWLKAGTKAYDYLIYINDEKENNEYRKVIDSLEKGRYFPETICPDKNEMIIFNQPDTATGQIKSLFGESFSNAMDEYENALKESDRHQSIIPVIVNKSYKEKTNIGASGIGNDLIIILMYDLKVKPYMHSIERFSKLITECLERQQRIKNTDINEVITNLYEKSLEVANYKNMLNTVCSFIQEKTYSDYCMLYRLAHWGKDLGIKSYFYLGGTGEFVNQDLENYRFNEDEGILGKVLNQDSIYYNQNIYESADNTHKIDHLLEDLGMTSPELYGVKISTRNGLTIAVLVIIRETSEEVKKQADPKIDRLLSETSKHIANIMYLRSVEWHDEKLYTAQQVFLKGILDITKFKEEKEFIAEFQNLVNKSITDKSSGIVSPGSFVIYERQEKIFKAYNEPDMIKGEFYPPRFTLNEGLTGSVIFNKNGQYYEPNVENNKGVKNDCKAYWDEITRTADRMYFSKHVRYGLRDFIFIVIGARGEAFNPDQIYKSLSEMMEIISTQFVKVIEQREAEGLFKLTKEKIDTKEKLESELKILSKILTRSIDLNSPEKEITARAKDMIESFITNETRYIEKENKYTYVGQSIHTALNSINQTIKGTYDSAKIINTMINNF